MYVFCRLCYVRVLKYCMSSYAFDVNPQTQTFQNRRVFAYVDTGVADGIQLDAKGNVYSGCGDGVHVRIVSLSPYPLLMV